VGWIAAAALAIATVVLLVLFVTRTRHRVRLDSLGTVSSAWIAQHRSE